jgi:hypothetical protein
MERKEKKLASLVQENYASRQSCCADKYAMSIVLYTNSTSIKIHVNDITYM